ncbi:FG-GAP repeat domain-containing protein [Streptomyces sp. NPDC017941]|uniref:FG-GAP repeat domain-containing protein n=1 Tax=Streptomyces sp. NPDC017941 TaxID=3365018 RepID=UPI0037BE1BEB
MLRKRSRLIAAPVAAVALTLTAAGYQASASGSPAADGGERSGKAAAATPCLVGATTLVGDLDGDGRPDKITNPDLVILNNDGDGVWERAVRLTGPGSGPGKYSYEVQQRYGASGTPAEPPSMPTSGWKHFYKPCS